MASSAEAQLVFRKSGNARVALLERKSIDACNDVRISWGNDGIPRTVAPIEEVQLYTRDAAGKRTDVSFMDLVEKTMGTKVQRTDLHLSRGRNGELFLTSRVDGTIRVLVP